MVTLEFEEGQSDNYYLCFYKGTEVRIGSTKLIHKSDTDIYNWIVEGVNKGFLKCTGTQVGYGDQTSKVFFNLGGSNERV